MRIRFSLRTMFLAVFLVALLLWLFTPVAGINSATCARIRPGMTEQQAHDIVGVPPGWYDGVGGIRTDAPGYKGYKPSWKGLRGEILIDLDDSGRVAQATFYSGDILSWSPTSCLWERFTRIKYASLSLSSRLILHLVVSLVAILILGPFFVRADAKNRTALYGVLGLMAAPILGVAVLSDDSVSDRLIAYALLTPIVGATVGIVIGFIVSVFTTCRPRKPKHEVADADADVPNAIIT
jgi:hypothetical protein